MGLTGPITTIPTTVATSKLLTQEQNGNRALDTSTTHTHTQEQEQEQTSLTHGDDDGRLREREKERVKEWEREKDKERGREREREREREKENDEENEEGNEEESLGSVVRNFDPESGFMMSSRSKVSGATPGHLTPSSIDLHGDMLELSYDDKEQNIITVMKNQNLFFSSKSHHQSKIESEMEIDE